MKKPKVEKVNLPYASSVASFAGDQGDALGNSFLGRIFSGMKGRQTRTSNYGVPAAAAAAPVKFGPGISTGRSTASNVGNNNNQRGARG